LGIGAAGLIILAGLLYLYADGIPLAVVLGICIAAVIVMGVAAALETKASGAEGIVSYLHALCFFVLAAFLFAALVFVLIN